MERYFFGLTEQAEEEKEELITSNFQAMVDAIIIGVPDPRFDNE